MMAIYEWICALAVAIATSSSLHADETVPDLIRKHGYPCEEHFVTTEDGYILTLHRIPHGKEEPNSVLTMFKHPFWKKNQRKQPIIMQHGLLSSSGSWTLDLPQKVPAYIMADAGYDVWLTNVRGNIYSRNHTHLSPQSKEFWQFSWDEMAYYDVPAFIDYILNTTKHSKLFYIGHSMGTTIFFGAMTMRPTYNNKIKAMIGLAPVGTVKTIRSPFRFFSHVSSIIIEFMERNGRYEFLPKDSCTMKLANTFCKLFRIDRVICENFLFLFTGFDKKEFNSTWIPKIDEQLLSGTSLYTVHHFAQEYLSGKFQYYDYGANENEKHYGQVTAPEYDVSKITSPVYLIWAKNDYLADEEDVLFLIKNLPNVKSHFPVAYEGFNHLDFLWAKDAEKLVYESVLKLMENHENMI